MARSNYHHGALREALLEATLALIETEGIGAVSLRQVARMAGVSPGAPYHHFADRAALLTALSDEGFRRLTSALTEARATATTSAKALEAILTAYIDFARTDTAYFRLMFRPELKESPKSPAGAEAGEAAFAILETTIGESLPDHTDTAVLTIATWSLAHGYASLWLDGQLDHRVDDPAALAHQIAALVTAVTGRCPAT